MNHVSFFHHREKVRGEAMLLSDTQALRLWHDVVLDQVRDDLPDLTLRQMAVLLTVYLEPPPHTVRALAKKLDVTKPVITRALNTLGQHGLTERRRDPNDRRNVLVQRTLKGALFLETLADAIRRAAEAVAELPDLDEPPAPTPDAGATSLG